MTGGEKSVAEGTKGNLADDALSDVKTFRTDSPANGEYRVILMGAAGQGGKTNPFGNQLTINGRTIDVTQGAENTGATLGGQNNDGLRVRVAGTAQAPMLVIDVTINANELKLQFANGATVSGLIVEPASGVSALGPSVSASSNSSVEQCSSAEAQIQKAASNGNIVQPTNTAAPVPGPSPVPPAPTPISGN
jgi:hypothetical protein